jgi:hypothetical protein
VKGGFSKKAQLHGVNIRIYRVRYGKLKTLELRDFCIPLKRTVFRNISYVLGDKIGNCSLFQCIVSIL